MAMSAEASCIVGLIAVGIVAVVIRYLIERHEDRVAARQAVEHVEVNQDADDYLAWLEGEMS